MGITNFQTSEELAPGNDRGSLPRPLSRIVEICPSFCFVTSYLIYSEYSITRKYSVSTDYSTFFFQKKQPILPNIRFESYLNLFDLSLFEIKRDRATADGRTLRGYYGLLTEDSIIYNKLLKK